MARYCRDKRSPEPKSESVSKSMRGNRSKDTKPELALRRQLRADGMRGYRLNLDILPGRPDIAFPSRKIAIFVHGCYWHHCPRCCLKIPQNNHDFWMRKFEANVARDLKNIETLESTGWRVLVFWECEIESHLNEISGIVKHLVQEPFDDSRMRLTRVDQ